MRNPCRAQKTSSRFRFQIPHFKRTDTFEYRNTKYETNPRFTFLNVLINSDQRQGRGFGRSDFVLQDSNYLP